MMILKLELPSLCTINKTLAGGEEYAKKEQEEDFLSYWQYIKEDDFLGVQNYSREIHGPNGCQSR